MTELLEKGKMFEWTLRCEASFQELKKRLTTTPVFTMPRRFMARRFLSIDLTPSEGETEGVGPGEEGTAARELGGGRWLSVAQQRSEIGGVGFGQRKEKREWAKLGRTARREADWATWAGWQVGQFWEKVMELGWAAMEIGLK
jgi:hypothetical protein